MRRVVLALATVAAVLVGRVATAQTPVAAAPPAATPQQEAEARAHFERGLGLFNAQDYNGALAEFQAAFDLSHRPTVLYNIGVAHQALHHYPEAARAIEQYLREATVTPERRRQVEQGLAEIRQFIAHVTVSGLPQGATVTVDGDRVGAAPFSAAIAVGTGRHVLVAHAAGFRDGQETILIAGGQDRDVHFALEPETTTAAATPVVHTGALEVRGAPSGAAIEVDGHAATAANSSLSPGSHRVRVSASGYVPWEGNVEVPDGSRRTANVRLVRAGRLGPAPFIAASVATLVFGIGTIVTGVLTLDTHSQFQTRMQESPDVQSLANQGDTERTLTNVFLGVTVVGAAASVILFTRTSFNGNDSTVDVAIAPRIEGGGEGAVRIRF